ncbi:MAG: IPT/TIG domain-containing protein [Melioribacteraceae bacterium]|nr:IPT/TIG domain-containing protein [Melioribacteraceae bacterium]
MKNLKQILVTIIGITILISACKEEPAPSLYQQLDKGATPVITSVVPDKEALAGVTEIVINGSNFSANKDDNFVFFGTAKATVISATPTQLIVKAPALVKNALDLKIAVQGVENFSNIVKYNLLEAVGVYYNFTKAVENPITVTVDNNENVYVYLKDAGIRKITPDGKISNWAQKGAESFFFDMKFGPNNVLIGTRNLRALFAVEEGKTPSTYVTFPTGIAILALDFDANKNIWCAGSGGSMFSVTPAKVTNSFTIDYSVSALRVYNGYLYVAGKSSTEEAIYRYKINSETSLGTKEKFFDIGAAYGLNKVNVNGIAFGNDGEMILGTNQTDAFISVKNGVASKFYPGLILPEVKSLMWGTKKNLFYTREIIETSSTGTVTIYYTLVRVDMQKTTAPYFGRQ